MKGVYCLWVCGLFFLYTATTGTEGARCGDGWLKFRHSCYLFKNLKQDWATAQSLCTQLYANLVEVESAKEDKFLIGEISKRHKGSKVQYWTGGNAIENGNGKFMWAQSRIRFSRTYTHWYPGQPNNGGEECVTYDTYKGIAWHDYRCDYKTFFICEKELF